jgi:hypothetical protein
VIFTMDMIMFRFLLDRRVGARLSFAFSLLLLAMLGLGATALVGMGRIQGEMDKIVQTNKVKTELLQSRS